MAATRPVLRRASSLLPRRRRILTVRDLAYKCTAVRLSIATDFFTWTRDGALVLKCISDIFSSRYDARLQGIIQDYAEAQARLQGVSNPSGSLQNGTGLAEPKFNVDFSEYTGDWGMHPS